MSESTLKCQNPRERMYERIKQAILDQAATWEETFDAGPGDVVSVSDAASVASRFLAVLVEPPGDLREQMTAAIRRHHNASDIRSEDWSVAGDVCACGVMVTDWVGHLAEVMASVCREAAARRIAAAEARAGFAEGQLSARRDHETRWETAEAKLARLRARVRQLRRDREEYWTRASTAEAQVAALQRDLEEAREERDAARLVSEGRTMGQYDALDIYREHCRFHPAPFADCQACRMGVAISRDLPSRPDVPEEIRRLAESAGTET